MNDSIEKIAKKILAQEVGVFPFDTIWGITGLMTKSVAKKIYALKKRTADKPFLIILPDSSFLDKYAKMPKIHRKFVEFCWPGPITLIFKKKDTVPEAVTAGLQTIGVRVPKHPELNQLLNLLRGPIISTSANVSTVPYKNTADGQNNELWGEMDFMYTQAKPHWKEASTIVDCTKTKPILLRKGAEAKKIEAYILKNY
jgi:L-threonylcarbamoyladenylate synthase